MLTNKELIWEYMQDDYFIRNNTNTSYKKESDYKVFYSYSTPVAILFKHGYFLVSERYYSSTTCRHVSNLINIANEMNFKIIRCYDIRISLEDNIKIKKDDMKLFSKKYKKARVNHSKNYWTNMQVNSNMDIINMRKLIKKRKTS